MKAWILALGFTFAAGAASADNLCKVNPYTKEEAAKGKVAFDSHCALCHQYSMQGREPGNEKNESPSMTLLSASDVKFVDGNAGVVPPLLGDAYFRKQQDKSLAEWTSQLSGAANSFPPKQKMEVPMTYLQIAAYVLYRNCGKM